MDDTHVYPDVPQFSREHVLTRTCWCKPTIEVERTLPRVLIRVLKALRIARPEFPATVIHNEAESE